MENAEEFVKLVCDFLHLPVEIVKSKDRHHKFCEARQVISYILLLHTKLYLRDIAKELNYVSHASPLRDKRQVTNFFEIDKKFAAKFLPLLLDAEVIADEHKRKENAIKSGKPMNPGDICWFWNKSIYTRFPIIGILERSYMNEDKQQRFVSREHPAYDFSHCAYAGKGILPEELRRCSFNIIPESYFEKEKVTESTTC